MMTKQTAFTAIIMIYFENQLTNIFSFSNIILPLRSYLFYLYFAYYDDPALLLLQRAASSATPSPIPSSQLSPFAALPVWMLE